MKITDDIERDEALRELLRQQSYDASTGLPYDSFLGISKAPGALARSSEGPEVLNLQYRLRDLGLYDGELNGVYDSATVNAVRTAQYMRGDELNGVATVEYQQVLYGPDAPVAMEVRLSEGRSGPAVKALQQNLAALGLYDEVPDSVYDAGVVESVRQFQRAYGYGVDGVAEPALQKAVAWEANRLAGVFGNLEYTCEREGEALPMARVTIKEGARLRETPEQSGRTLRRLSQGQTMLVLEQGTQWCRVRAEDAEGYIRSDLVIPYDQLMVQLKYTAADEDLVYTIGSSAGDVLAGAKLPCEVFETTLAANDRQVDVNSLENFVTVDTGENGPSLNLRQEPDGDSTVLDTVANGTSLPALRRASEWTQVRYKGNVGFLMNRYLTFWTGPADALDEALDMADAEAPVTGYVVVCSAVGRRAPVYGEDEDGAEILGHLPNDTRLELLDVADGWCHIRYEGHEGYMVAEDLTLEEAGEDDVEAVDEAEGVALKTEAPER